MDFRIGPYFVMKSDFEHLFELFLNRNEEREVCFHRFLYARATKSVNRAYKKDCGFSNSNKTFDFYVFVLFPNEKLFNTK